MKALIIKLLGKKFVYEVVLTLVKELAKNSKNKVDDEMVRVLEQAIRKELK